MNGTIPSSIKSKPMGTVHSKSALRERPDNGSSASKGTGPSSNARHDNPRTLAKLVSHAR